MHIIGYIGILFLFSHQSPYLPFCLKTSVDTTAQVLIFPKILGFVSKFELMAANEELKVEVEQVQVTSPSSGGLARQGSIAKSNCLCSPTTHAGSFRCRLHRSPSGIQRTKSINSDAKVDHNENDDMKTVIAP